MTRPDLIILGQITVDHVVPAWPGPWAPQLGGNSLYAAAGARLWIEAERIGIVSRIGAGFPFEVAPLLRAAGICHVALNRVPSEHLVEWIIYEEDGSRRCLPRNAQLRHIGTEGGSADTDAYLDHLLGITPTADEIPEAWLPAAAVHLAPQARDRHPGSLARLRNRTGFISVDPSPYYSRSRDAFALTALLAGTTAFLPSELEIGHLAIDGDWAAVARGLCKSGFPEVVIKRGKAPVIIATADTTDTVPTPRIDAFDPTGAGDAFCGAYAACRLLGLSPSEAARRATIAAGLVIGSKGVNGALDIDRSLANRIRGGL